MSRYQPYPSYKPSGIEWLGKIPEEWEFDKFRYIFTFSKGLTITKANLLETGVPCVNYGEIHSKYGFEVSVDKHPLKCVDPSYLSSDKSSLMSHGDFVFADTSEDLDGAGNFTHVSGDTNIFAGYHTIIARQQKNNNARFLAYLIDSTEFRTQIRLAVKGVKVFSITQAILRDSTVWLPNTEEQTTIANFLDKETAKIDTLIQKQQRMIELLKEKRQAVISHAVTKGLDPNVKMKDSGVEWLGEVPEHWEVWKIAHAFNTVGSGTTPSTSNQAYFEGKTPWVTTGELRENTITETSKCVSDEALSDYSALSLFPKGSVVIAMYGATIGRLAILGIEATTNQACCVITDSKVIDNQYLYYWLMAYRDEIIQLGYGGGQPNISQDKIINLKVSAPDLDEQQQIIEFIKEKATKIDTLIEKANKAIDLLKERRTALISAAVTGKIDVREAV